MKLNEFKRATKSKRDPIEVLYSLDKLTQLPEDKKCKTQAIDPRTKKKGKFYQVYPIGIDRHHVYIVCPWCKEIHQHGNDQGRYAGHRVSHCFKGNGYEIRQAPKRRTLLRRASPLTQEG